MSSSSLHRFRGCLLGLALGDTYRTTSPPPVGRRVSDFPPPKTRTGERRWTAETRMALDVVGSIVSAGKVDPDDIAQRFGRTFRKDRGYDPAVARRLRRFEAGESWEENGDRTANGRSGWGGGTTGAPVVGLLHSVDAEGLDASARRAAAIVYPHPLEQECAILVARAIAAATSGAGPGEIFRIVEARAQSARMLESHVPLESSGAPAAGAQTAVVDRTSTDMTSLERCVNSISLALGHLDSTFDDLAITALALGGDTHRVLSLAGSLWGAMRGVDELPAEGLDDLEARYEIDAAAHDLYDRVVT